MSQRRGRDMPVNMSELAYIVGVSSSECHRHGAPEQERLRDLSFSLLVSLSETELRAHALAGNVYVQYPP